jgi:hypothetical protein
MDIPEDFTILCSNCGSSLTDVIPLGADEWLSTCRDCFQQDTLTDGDLAKAKRGGRKSITGRPLGSSGAATKTQKTNPLIADAQRRATETETTNPLIENAIKRAGKAHAEVHHV